MFEYPKKLQKIFDKLNKNNINPVIVGGYVRDKLLNIESTDIDVELYGIKSFGVLEKIISEFGSVNSVGKSFGVCKLTLKKFEIDFTLPRIDSKISSGHRGFKVDLKSDLNFEQAAIRRDFTINAIGYDVVKNKIIDPFGGQKDLKTKTLKAVSFKTFRDDPLRVLRAAVFCSRFDFHMNNKLFKECKNMCDKNLLDELPKERVFGEIKKILLKTKKPSLGFKVLKDINALKYLKPLNKLDADSFEYVLNAIDNLTKIKTKSKKTKLTLMLALVCHKFSTSQTQEFISNLSTEKTLLKNILPLLETSFKKSYSDSELFHLATKVNIENFLIFHNAVNFSIDKNIFTTLKKRAKRLKILNEKAEPFLKGKDILEYGIKPSAEYSQILNLAYEAQMNLEIKNKKEATEWLKDYLSPKTPIFLL